MARHQEDRFYVHFHYTIPIFLVQFQDRGSANDSGIVEKNADTLKTVKSTFYNASAISSLGDVHTFEVRTTASRRYIPLNLYTSAFGYTSQRSVCAFAGEQQGGGPAYTRGCARDDRGLSLQALVEHFVPDYACERRHLSAGQSACRLCTIASVNMSRDISGIVG